MKLEVEPRVTAGPSFFASAIDWMRRVARVVNPAVDLITTISGYFVSGVLAIANGGTGASTAAGARNNLGLANHQTLTVGAGGDITCGAGATGMTVSGYATIAGPIYLQALVNGNPNWNLCQFQTVHFPGVWAGYRFDVNPGSGATFDMRNNGTGYSSGGWVATSDGRFKVNRQPLGDVLAWIDEVVPCEYDRTDVKNLDGTALHRAGFIADQFEPHAPSLVLRDRVTEDNPDPIRSLDYDGAGAYLWRATQQLKAIVEAQAEEIRILKGSSNG